MRGRYKYITGCLDIRDDEGLWLKSHKVANGLIHKTRSGDVWNSIVNRTDLGGFSQTRSPTYYGSENMFPGYQEFTEWCQDQYGYMNKNPNGTFWHVDKDILIPGNKDYSPEACMFVPSRVNNLLTSRYISRGDYAVGVQYHADSKLFQGRISVQGKVKSKYFRTATDAHRFWQEGKVEAIQNFLKYDDETIQHSELSKALQTRLNELEFDIINNKITHW